MLGWMPGVQLGKLHSTPAGGGGGGWAGACGAVRSNAGAATAASAAKRDRTSLFSHARERNSSVRRALPTHEIRLTPCVLTI